MALDRENAILASESVQRTAWRSLSLAAPSDVRSALGISQKDVGSTFYHGTLEVPGPQFNKIHSFGVDGQVGADTIDDAAAWLAHACGPHALLMVPDISHTEALEKQLLDRGFARYPVRHDVLHLEACDVSDLGSATAVRVERVTAGQANLFGQVLAESMDAPNSGAWLGALVAHPALSAYLAFSDAMPIGAAALFVEKGWGWLFLAAVRPEARGQGAQTALIRRRLHDGIEAGVHTFCVAVAHPAPDHADVFASYRNVKRAGFKLCYSRINYVV